MKPIRNLKKLYSAFLVSTMLLLCTPTLLATSSIQIVLDGQVLETTTSPIMEEGTTLVPLRLISENLGATVNYDKLSQTIRIYQNHHLIKLIIGEQTAWLNEEKRLLSTAPRLINGTTFVPLRFISENLNCKVNWDAKTQTITLTSTQNPELIHPVATLTIKDFGSIKLELYPEYAPNTVNNFIYLADNEFYNGLTFHRVIDDFMIQGGDPLGTGIGGPGYSIPGEFNANGFTQNTLSHEKGIISMARSLDPNSAGSQFFIVTSDHATHLDGQYAAFGKVISGLDVALKLQQIPTNSQDAPLAPIIIESLTIDLKDYEFDTITYIPN